MSSRGTISLDRHAVRAAPRPHLGRVLRLVGRAVVGFVGLVLSVVLALGAVMAAARTSASPVAFLGTGLVVLAGGSAAAGWLATARSRLTTRRRVQVAGATAAITSAVVAVSLAPPNQPPPQPADVPGMQLVNLATGSRLAYVRAAGAEPRQPETVVFLHGGPGVADMAGDLEFFGQLTQDGYDVVLYDQIGAGHSARLENPADYSLDRDVADLRALLDHLDIERAALIGHSYGGTLAAAYVAEHPDRVSKVAFLTPGEIRPHAVSYGTGMVSRLPDDRRLQLNLALIEPRSLVGWLLSQVNPAAAHAFSDDAEMDARFDRITALAQPGLSCAPPTELPRPSGLGSYTNAMIRSVPDLRGDLARVHAPALVVKPQCDYLPWVFGTDIAAAMPNARLVYLRDAGHSLYAEEPAEVLALLRAFLAGTPLPIEPATDLAPPPDLDGPIG